MQNITAKFLLNVGIVMSYIQNTKQLVWVPGKLSHEYVIGAWLPVTLSP